MKQPPEPHLPHPLEPDESPGVPGFDTWRGVYLLVFAVFVLVVIGLAIVAHVYG